VPSRFTAKHWRDRAEEARAHAEAIRDETSQRLMLKVAADYDKLADRAAELERTEAAADSSLNPV
jgi:hypothetical protein